MRFFILLLVVFVLAGCSSSEKLLDEATSKRKAPVAEAPQTAPAGSKSAQENQATNSKKTMYQKAPALSIDVNKQYIATLTTSAGTIEVALNGQATPVTVNNFIFLARENFYDGTIFHRTIPGFMVQGGDPTGTGSGGPGYQFADEPFTGEYTRGTVAMANAGPNTNGSQFFIMHKDTSLPKNYVIFGKVQSGLEVVDAIATAETVPGGEGSSPQKPVAIETLTIREQ